MNLAVVEAAIVSGVMFDPESGRVLDREALRSIGVKTGPAGPVPVVRGDTKIVPRLNEETGRIGGYETHHSDGRKDATVYVGAARGRGKSKEI